MKRLILYVIILILAVLAGLVLNTHPGYVLVSFKNWTFESSVWFSVIIIVIVYCILYWLYRISLFLLSSRGNVKSWYRQKQFIKAHSITGGGLLALQEADWKTAERLLLNGVKSSSIPVVNYLSAARAAQEQNDFKARDRYLEKSRDFALNIDEKKAILLTKARLELDHQEYEAALASLQKFQNYQERHPYYLKLLARLYKETSEWQKLIELLPRLKRRKVYDDATFDALEFQAYENLLQEASLEEGALMQHWKNIPKAMKQSDQLTKIYANHLIQMNAYDDAAVAISDYLTHDYDETLVEQFWHIQPSSPKKHMSAVKGWIKKYGESAALLTLSAQLALLLKDARGAQEEATKSLALQETDRAYLLLAKASEMLGDHEAAQRAYQKGLHLL